MVDGAGPNPFGRPLKVAGDTEAERTPADTTEFEDDADRLVAVMARLWNWALRRRGRVVRRHFRVGVVATLIAGTIAAGLISAGPPRTASRATAAARPSRAPGPSVKPGQESTKAASPARSVYDVSTQPSWSVRAEPDSRLRVLLEDRMVDYQQQVPLSAAPEQSQGVGCLVFYKERSLPFRFFIASPGPNDLYYCHVTFGSVLVEHGVEFVLVAVLGAKDKLQQLLDLTVAGAIISFPTRYVDLASPELTVTLQ
jgi:hypothetical protein